MYTLEFVQWIGDGTVWSWTPDTGNITKKFIPLFGPVYVLADSL
jgi:hypothetical protein